MTRNQVVSAMFNVKKFIHMVRIVSVEYWNEYPELLGLTIISSYTQVAFGDQWKSLHGSTLYVLVAMFSTWEFTTWIYLVCLVSMFHLLHYLFMGIQCMFGSHDMVIIMDLHYIGPQPWFSWIGQLLVLCQLWVHLSFPLYQIDIMQSISPITSF